MKTLKELINHLNKAVAQEKYIAEKQAEIEKTKSEINELKQRPILELSLKEYAMKSTVDDYAYRFKEALDKLNNTQQMTVRTKLPKKIGKLFTELIYNAPSVDSAYNQLRKAINGDKGERIEEAEKAYQEAFNKEYDRLYTQVEPLLNEFLSYQKGITYNQIKNDLEREMPKPKTKIKIESELAVEAEMKRSMTLTEENGITVL